MSAFAADFDGAPEWKVAQRREQARRARDVFAEWSEPCHCGRRIGDHAAFKDRDRGGWPCTAEGCLCLLDEDEA